MKNKLINCIVDIIRGRIIYACDRSLRNSRYATGSCATIVVHCVERRRRFVKRGENPVLTPGDDRRRSAEDRCSTFGFGAMNEDGFGLLRGAWAGYFHCERIERRETHLLRVASALQRPRRRRRRLVGIPRDCARAGIDQFHSRNPNTVLESGLL